MLWLFALFLLFLLLTLVGHGLWVLLATIFKALFPSEVERCRHCERLGRMSNGRCPWCGKAQSAPLNDEAADVAAIGRQLRRWQARGLLKPEEVVRLIAKIDALQKPPGVRPEVIRNRSENATVRRPAAPSLASDGLEGRPTAAPARPAGGSQVGSNTAPIGRPRLIAAQTATTLAPAGVSPPNAAPTVAARPRRSFGEMLSTFMEERNIRWGELVGGLIIVCSSVALVISIWDQLKAIPYFQFFIFVAVSAALFGIGLYTEHRWKLTSTSRGVLIIATLLVPLNFVAMVATRRPGFDPVALVTELAALAVFSTLVYRAGRVLVEAWAGWLSLGVVGNSGMLLLLIGRPSLLWATCVAAAATMLHAASLIKPLTGAHRRAGLTATIANRLFILMGAAAFALAVALSMVVVRASDHVATLHAIAPLVAMGSVPIVLCGMAVMRGLATSTEAALRTAGTFVALLGAATMLAATAMAWPMPISLIAVGVVNFAALAAIAFVYRLRPLHLLAAASLAISYIVACHWADGHIAAVSPTEQAWALARLFIAGQTGLWLVAFVAFLLVVAELLERRGHGDDARYYLGAGAAAAAVSLVLVAWPVVLSGGAESARAGLVFACYGIAALAINLRLGRRAVESLASALLYVAALLGATDWLIDQPWVMHDPAQFAARPSLQCYAAACAAVSLAFLLLRLIARRWSRAIGVEPATTSDRFVLRIISAASLLLAGWQATPGILAELFSTTVTNTAWANDTAPGWVLLSLCATGLLAALWHGWRDDDLTAAVLLSINAAVLMAIPAAPMAATASALRWALAIVFAASAGVLWFRTNLANVSRRLGCPLQITTAAAPIVRAIWLVASALPVVLCSTLVALMQIGGRPAAGPLPGTWFAKLGMELSHLLPLALIVLSLIAYAVREASPLYAFIGGLVANMTVAGGYALLIRRFGAIEAALLVQLSTVTAAAWAIGWLACRRRVLKLWRQPASRSARPLLRLQVAQAALGSMLLLATATVVVFFAPTDGLPRELHDWVSAVGSPWGWFTIAVTCLAAVYRMLHFREGVRPELGGLLVFAVLSLAAASVEAVLPDTAWAYRTLMLSWAIYALAMVVAASRAAMTQGTADDQGRRSAWVRAAAIWVRLSGLLAVALALKTVLFEGIRSEELLWAAPAIGIASAACAAMAVWLRREGWAFTAGLGANLAASLIVAHRIAAGGHAVAEEWILLWQANTTAAAVVAIVWLTAWRRMYARSISADRAAPAGEDESSAVAGAEPHPGYNLAELACRGDAPVAERPGHRRGKASRPNYVDSAAQPRPPFDDSALLTVQVGAVAVSALGLLSTALALLLVSPTGQSLLAERFASNAGWFAWLSACGATAGYLYHVSRRMVIDVLAVFLLGAGVRAAIARFVVEPSTAISLLASAWLGAGFFLLVIGYFTNRWFASRSNAGHGEWLREILQHDAFERWVAAIPLLIAAVALRGAFLDAALADGLGFKLLAAAVLPAAISVWMRSPWHLYSHLLLINLAASLFWYARPNPLWTDLLLANALAAAAMAIFWSIWSGVFGLLVGGGWGRAWPNKAESRQYATRPGDAPVDATTGASPRQSATGKTTPAGAALPQPPAAHAAAVIAISLLAIGAVCLWFSAALHAPLSAGSRLIWLTSAMVAAAACVALWDRRAPLAAPGIYATGLAAIALGLVEHGEQGRMLVRLTAPCFAGGLCLAAGVRLFFAVMLRARLGLPRQRRWRGWFTPLQACFAVVATAVSLWIGVGFDSPAERFAGPVTTAFLLATAVLMSAARGSWSGWWRVGALASATIFPAELAWCWTAGHDTAILWIHRQVALLAAFGLVAAACELVATRRLASATWLEGIRRFLPLAIATLLGLLAVIVTLELQYRAGMPQAADGTRPNMPMAMAAKLAVVFVLVELIVLALRYAIVAARDPLAMTARGRAAYVYAAEVLALIVCLHFRTTLPKLLPFSFIQNWWTLIVMAVAFVGAGLSEFFRRRQLEVLSLPLARTATVAPLVPVLALLLYLAWRPADINEWLFHARLISDEAVFFLAAAFYALQARLRRSLTAAGCSALAGNIGLWLLWQRLRLEFLVHPQLWLIPPALAVLAAEYINRDRLSRPQSSAVRYLALSAIYVSSTADVFISHVGRDISLPLVLVLMGLSVLGILVGMLLEIRPFVYLGFTFLLVDLCIMVYHAAWDLGHTWVFWATGIAVGAAIIALFAVFEKRRNEAAKQVDSHG